MNYGALISDAFWIAWRNRFLWFFGFFVAVGGASFNIPGPQGDAEEPVPPWLSSFGLWIRENLALFLVVVLSAAVVVILIAVVLSTISRAGLSESVAALRRGEERRFGSTWRAGLSNFWRLLGLRALFFLISLALFLLFFAPLAILFLVAAPFGGGLGDGFPVGAFVGLLLLFLLAVLSLLLLSVPLYVVAQLATRELVVGERRGVFGSLGVGFGLFRRNLSRSLLVWLIQAAISLGVGIAALIFFLVLGLVFVAPTFLLFSYGYPTAVAVAVGVVGGLLFLIPYLLVTGAVGAFNHAYWTLAYLQLTAEEATPQPGGVPPAE